jgi:aryl-alcohol dehydrogenase-like predicted oxidoreductase
MTSSLPQRKLGTSDLRISPLGLGCWQFSQGRGLFGGFWANVPGAEIEAIVRASIEGGINWFDTAESYGGGQSEKALSAALKKAGMNPGGTIIATKWMPLLRTARSIGKTIGRRLDSLGGFSIDLYQIHQPIALASVRSQMAAMANLVKDGRIRHIGVSNFSAKRMLRADEALKGFGLRVVSNQVHYSLLNRKIETNGILDAAKERGITIIAYSPLEQGILTGRFHERPDLIRSLPAMRRMMGGLRPARMAKSRPVIEALREIAPRYKATPAQVALNWLIHFHGDIVVAIPGATKVGQARDNAEALTFALTRDELDHLDRVSAFAKK